MRSFMRLILWLAPCCAPHTCWATTIELTQEKYVLGDRVTAKIRCTGEVTIENDIMATSTTESVSGEREVELGSIKEPGLFAIRVFGADAKVATAAILVMPNDPAGDFCVVASSGDAPKSLIESKLIEKLLSGTSPERLQKAAKRVFPTWLQQNIVSINTTSAVCVICIVPGGQAACPACASSATGNALDLGFALLEDCVTQMQEAKELTVEQAKNLKLAFKARGLAKILQSDHRIKKALEGIALAINIIVEEPNAKLVLKGTVQEGKKACLLIEVLKKVK